MSSLSALVSSGGAIKRGDPDGDDVRAVQLALSQAGYKVGIDGYFGPQTDHSVRVFQEQHGLLDDGIVGPVTAALLDAPHDALLQTANTAVLAASSGPPHDDTASLLAFYGKPWENQALLLSVSCPWPLYYDGQLWPHPVRFHGLAAHALSAAFSMVWEAAGKDANSELLKHVRNFSGSYNYRPIRGSSRLSCHAFGAAIDFDAEHLPLGQRIDAAEMPLPVVVAFKNAGFYWGGDFRGRADPQHFQFAHE